MGQGRVNSLAPSPVLGCLPALPHSLCPGQLNEAVISKTQRRSSVLGSALGWECEPSGPPQLKPGSSVPLLGAPQKPDSGLLCSPELETSTGQ